MMRHGLELKAADLNDLNDDQRWMLVVIAQDIQAEVEQEFLSYAQAVVVLQRLVKILRDRYLRGLT